MITSNKPYKEESIDWSMVEKLKEINGLNDYPNDFFSVKSSFLNNNLSYALIIKKKKIEDYIQERENEIKRCRLLINEIVKEKSLLTE